MRLGAKLDEWQAAGLIDGDAAAAIRAHEDGRHRPVALFAVAGLGALALGLGVLLVVAANWDALPAWSKLAAHLFFLALAGAAALHFTRNDRVGAGEVSLFLLGALTLAGIALHSQVYQLTGPLWQALAWWTLMVSPALLLLGRTRLTAYGYGGMLVALAIAYVTEREADVLGGNLAAALPSALVLIGLVRSGGERRKAFHDALLELGVVLALLGASLAQLGWTFGVDRDDAGDWAVRLPLAVALAALVGALAFWLRSRSEAVLLATVVSGSAMAAALALALPHGSGPLERFFGALVYLALWGAVAAAATRAGWRRLFGVAVAAAALRLFLIYFELFYSLAFTGVGLIVAGVLLIALTWGWSRIMRRSGR
ncbi:DUF2157 domain-containing protein [Sphingomonas lenta]|uniref:DUF2157 domain-containing protein n=1 Tax=Sphingomonas lenta TaxID=1141887 RepID=A0A2A2SJJ2_9SPHN|nr:DUF2157 domain-containing protein [Sphingomonas lenta]PAX09399.1 hypothetical protein CKY28_01190 [Sphingomonas lenta]